MRWRASRGTGSSSFFFSSRRRHTRSKRDWSSDVCSSDLFHSCCRPSRNSTTRRKLRELLERYEALRRVVEFRDGLQQLWNGAGANQARAVDRKSVVKGKSAGGGAPESWMKEGGLRCEQ